MALSKITTQQRYRKTRVAGVDGLPVVAGDVNPIIDAVNDILDGTTTLTEVEVGNGTAAAPSMSFTSDTDTGIYRSDANQVAITTGGTGQVIFTDGTVQPLTDNDIDLGTASKEFKNVYLQGVITQSNTTDATTKDTGAIITEGGIGVEKAVFVGTTLTVASTTDSTTKDTGAIITEGGIGVEKAIFAGTTINAGTALTVGTNQTFAKEVNHTIEVATSTTADTVGANLNLESGDGVGTGGGGTLTVVAGASGAGATGNGGRTAVTGGAAASTNGDGGDVIITGGALSGTGKAGNVVLRSTVVLKQSAQAAKTTSTTLTAAEVIGGIITVNQGGGAASDLTLPLATDIDTALPQSAANDAFDFYVINISVVAAEDANILTNTGWTLVGGMDIDSYDAANNNSSAHFRARKTGAGAWTLYRLS